MVRRNPTRSRRLLIEPLEPRWLLSTLAPTPDDDMDLGSEGEGPAGVAAAVPIFAVEDKLFAQGFDTVEAEAGRAVAADGDYIVVGAPHAFRDDQRTGVAYVYLRNAEGTPADVSDDTWELTAALAASDGESGDEFGRSVAISGDTIVVGAYADDHAGRYSGAAYVFTGSGETWTERGKLTAGDAEPGGHFGISVSIDGDTIVVGAFGDNGGWDMGSTYVSGSGAAYVFTRTGNTWNHQQKLTAEDAATHDRFGISVAIDGDTIVAGAYNDDGGGRNSGSAYVFTRIGNTWNQQQKLTAQDGAENDNFGNSVSIDGDAIVVGADRDDDGGPSSGSAYVFTRVGNAWSQLQKLTADDGTQADRFGISVTIDGDSIAVGASGVEESTGSAYVFTLEGSSWIQQQKLTASDAASHDEFGGSVSIAGGTIVVGAYRNDNSGNGSGTAYAYGRNDGTWAQSATDFAVSPTFGNYGTPDGRTGESVAVDGDYLVVGAPWRDSLGRDVGSHGEATVFFRDRNGTPEDFSDDKWQYEVTLTAFDAADGDEFGNSVAIHGDTIVVGAHRDNDEAGAAYVFTRTGNTWSQQQKLTADDGAVYDYFGHSVAIEGDTIVVGAYMDDDGGTSSGAAYVFTRIGNGWSQQQKLTVDDGAAYDYFGASVTIGGGTIAVGAFGDDNGVTYPGAAYVFGRIGNTWSQQQKLTASDGAEFDYFGYSVSISGDTIVVGACGDDNYTGSAYVFTQSASGWAQQQKLTAGDGAEEDNFGFSVSTSGGTIVLGALGDDDRGDLSGSAYVFARDGNTWSQQQKVVADNGAEYDRFGYSVSNSGDTIAVGSPHDDARGRDSGAVYVFGPALDYGDLPDKALDTGVGDYNTLLSDNGPRHVIVPGLRMGARIDDERDAQQSALADGDDLPGGEEDDEDGLSTPTGYLSLRAGNAPAVPVTVTNTTGSAAMLYGWIDYDGDGVFDNHSEKASVAVPDGTTDVEVVLSFATAPWASAANTYARFRLSTDPAAAEPTGPAQDGEVEDYAVSIVSRPVPILAMQQRLYSERTYPTGDDAGSSVATYGDYLVVGAPNAEDDGIAQVYRRHHQGTPGEPNDDTWEFQAVLRPSGMGLHWGNFGKSVAVSDDTIVVGSPLENQYHGVAYVFARSAELWIEQQKLVPDFSEYDENDFGHEVSINGNTIVVGAPGEGGDAGAAYVFTRSGSGWSKRQKLTAADGDGGDRFGASVSFDGDTIVVGAPRDDDGGYLSGSAYVFTRSGNQWVQQQKITTTDAVSDDGFGGAVSVSGNYLIVGAAGVGTYPFPAGSAYIFTRNGSVWIQDEKLVGETGTIHTRFGHDVSVYGDTVLVGAYGEFSGASAMVHVFARSSSDWTRQQILTEDTDELPSSFGRSLAIWDHTVVVGAPSVVGPGPGSAYVFGPAIDHGDAPDAIAGTISGDYQTTINDDGPSHAIVPGLYMGTVVDHELTAAPSAAADGDDTSGDVPDDEDGLVAPNGELSLTAGNEAVVRISVSNTTGRQAVLYGWIDLNGDGVFDNAGERASVIVPDGTADGEVTLTFGAVPWNSPADTFARFRLSTDPAAAFPTGLASDGEVEDYPVHVVFTPFPIVEARNKLYAHGFDTQGDEFGTSVAADGDYVVVGAPNASSDGGIAGGVAYVYMRDDEGTAQDVGDDTWERIATLAPTDAQVGKSFGESVGISGDTIVVGAHYDYRAGYPSSGAAYVFTRNGSTWSQQKKLTAADAAGGDYFGGSVAISGGTVVVGAAGREYDDDRAGSAYVFSRNGSEWSQQQKLFASDGEGGDTFGQSVAIDGDTIIVGAANHNQTAGAAYIFGRGGSGWSQQQKLIAANAARFGRFGGSVAISGDAIVVSAWHAAYIFSRRETTWNQQQKLSSDHADIYFGAPVSIGGDTVAVGASRYGSVYVFTKTAGGWSEQHETIGGVGSVAISGDTIVLGAAWDDDGGTHSGVAYVYGREGGRWTESPTRLSVAPTWGEFGAPNDYTGRSVAVDGDYVAVGAPQRGHGADSRAGAVYVFARYQNETPDDGSDDTWQYQATLTASDADKSDEFGDSVAIQGDTIVVGARNDDDRGSEAGAAYVFTRSGNTWSQQQKLAASDATSQDYFGDSVAIDGDTIVVGAHFDDDQGELAGAAYIFTRSGDTWSQQHKLTGADGASQDYFGSSVAINGGTVVVGAPSTSGVDEDKIGSAYVFARGGGIWSQRQKLTAADSASADDFGSSVAIHESTIVIGASSDDDAAYAGGSAYVFTQHGPIWNQVQKITASDAMDNAYFGKSVSVSGNAIAIGAPRDDVQGAIYVFTRNGTTWHEQQKITAAEAAGGDYFGGAVSISADSIAVGAPYDDDGGWGSGAAHVLGPSSHPWQNSVLRFDVNNDGDATAYDVLMLINDINQNQARVLPTAPQGGPGPHVFLDVTGDGQVAPDDVLALINHINAVGQAPSGEGEAVEGLLMDVVSPSANAVSIESFGSPTVTPLRDATRPPTSDVDRFYATYGRSAPANRKAELPVLHFEAGADMGYEDDLYANATTIHTELDLRCCLELLSPAALDVSWL